MTPLPDDGTGGVVTGNEEPAAQMSRLLGCRAWFVRPFRAAANTRFSSACWPKTRSLSLDMPEADSVRMFFMPKIFVRGQLLDALGFHVGRYAVLANGRGGLLVVAELQMVLAEVDRGGFDRVVRAGAGEMDAALAANNLGDVDAVGVDRARAGVEQQPGADPFSFFVELVVVGFAPWPGSASAHQRIEIEIGAGDDLETVGTGGRGL